MSNWRFPLNPGEIPGVMMTLERTPIYATGIQVSSSGKEQRASFQTYPRYKYHISFEFLRTATRNATYTEFQQLLAILQMHQGQFDSFLIDDTEDDTVTAHGFGIGDGATTVYTLQRTLGGPRLDYAGLLGIRNVPATNVLLYNRDLTAGGGAVWAPNANMAIAPTPGIDQSYYPLGGSRLTATAADAYVLQSPILASATWITSAYVKRVTGSGLVHLTSNGGGGYVAISPTTSWQRFTIPTVTQANPIVGVHLATSGDVVDVDFIQTEKGTVATYPITTTVAAVKATPSYWPAYGDGFEPVLDFQYRPLVFINGGVTTNFSGPVAGTGKITFSPAPSSGDVLTWTGQYYRRVRLASDELNFKKFGVGYWEQKGLDLISVK